MTDTTERSHRSESPSQTGRPTTPSRALRIAEWIAFAALVAALVGALGPATEVQSAYQWPPRAMPKDAPTRVWYSPLLLAARFPESVTAEVPCGAPRVLAGNKGDPVTILSTARTPHLAGGVSFVAASRRLTVEIGDEVVARGPLAAAQFPLSECSYRFSMHDDRWSLTGGPGRIARSGSLPGDPSSTASSRRST